MLDISFLPVESPDEEESILYSVGESEDETCNSRSEFDVEDFDPADLEERTMRWVNRESENPQVQDSENPQVQESESPIVQDSESLQVQESESCLDQDFVLEKAMKTDHFSLGKRDSSDQKQSKESSDRNLNQHKEMNPI
ncbi:hypothetical protein ROHU_007283 [Labeo rohita]|uniref:Uncharacterized protein n=1 Tax=Labeo rohita TaxID=84645 RepID=A0A498MKS4_LABRO|nr:hypothetical protein ROHU_007283 [Labeo rohita]